MIYLSKNIFEIGHIAADQVYFLELNSKKSANLAGGKLSIFQKITETLKRLFILSKSCKHFLNNRQKENLK